MLAVILNPLTSVTSLSCSPLGPMEKLGMEGPVCSESVVEDSPGVSSVKVEFQVLGVGREKDLGLSN